MVSLPPSEWLSYVVIYGVFFVSAAIQGLTGFGFGMMTMALLPFFMSVKYASVIVAPLAIFNAGFLAWSLRRSIPWPMLTRLLVGAAVGVPFGVYILKAFPDAALKRLIGVVVLLYCLYNGWRRKTGVKADQALSMIWSLPAGGVGGALAGAVNVGGPPLILCLYFQPLKRDIIRATLTAFFFVVSVAKCGLVVANGMVTPDMLPFLAAVPMMWVGGRVGLRFGSRLDQQTFAKIVIATLAALGIVLLIQA